LAGVDKICNDHIDHGQNHKVSSNGDTSSISSVAWFRMIKSVFEWHNKRKGKITSTLAESDVFFHTQEGLSAPDAQFVFVPGIVDDHVRKVKLGHGHSRHITFFRPESRKEVKLDSTDPDASLLNYPNFFGDKKIC
jgi:choline dehydrogenase